MHIEFLLLFIPLIISLFVVVLFYWKSIKILRSQFENEQKSTRVYVRNLRCYSIAQMLTYGPALFYLCNIGGLLEVSSREMYVVITIAQAIANLTGFVNVMIFFSQGFATYRESFCDTLDLDLTRNEC